MTTNHRNARKTRCSKGHEFSESNTIYQKNKKGSVCRKCRICDTARSKDYYQRVYRKKVVKNLDFKRHGEFGTRLYGIWGKMISRCDNPSFTDYVRYGGRGITVCDEWRDYRNFSKWAKSNGYSDTLTIDRIDNDGNYEPRNCRWATPKEQANNRSTNHLIDFNGITKTLQEWSDEMGIQSSTLRYRLKAGWSAGDALTRRVQ